MKRFIFITLLFFFNCSHTEFNKSFDKKFDFTPDLNSKYSYSEIAKINTFKNKTLLLKTCEDLREEQNESYLPLIIFPLVPYANSYYSKPEEIKLIYVDYQIEMAIPKSFKNFLEKQSIFQRVKYSDNFREKKFDYTFTCKILKNSQKSRNTLYGLSLFPQRIIDDIPSLLPLIIHTNYPTINTEIEIRIFDSSLNKQIYGKLFSYENWYVTLESFREETKRPFFIHQEKILNHIALDIFEFFKEYKK